METPSKMRGSSGYIVPRQDALIAQSQSILSEALKERSLSLRLETPETAKMLKSICPDYVKNLESLIFDLFIEDQEDSLRLISLKDTKTKETVGFIFWRNIDPVEMRDWLNMQKIQSFMNLSLKDKAKGEGIVEEEQVHMKQLLAVDQKNIEVDNWIKIELMCVRSDKTGSKLGSILLAAALAFAVLKEGKSHGILQVAGGESNVSAIQLYKKFQFDEEGASYFHPPNSNLFVLWDIRQCLLSLKWEDFLLDSTAASDRKKLNSK